LVNGVHVWSIAKQSNGVRKCAAALLLFLWTTTLALSVWPDLHRFLHEDAQSPDHNCLVTQFQHQSLLSGFVAAVAPALPEAVSALPAPAGDGHFPLLCDYRLSPSRAPPAV